MKKTCWQTERKKQMGKISVAVAMIHKLPIGSRVQLEDDYPDTIHEIYGYTVNADGAYMEFWDGSSLNIENLEQIEKVI
mgnify:CR=1 FL=1